MLEDDIRPSKLIAENQKLLQNDIKEIMKNKEEFVEIPCPACNSHKYESIFDKQEFNFVKCIDCETVFINPRPTRDMLRNFYEKSECIKHWKNIFKESEDIRRKDIFSQRANTIIKLLKKFQLHHNLLVDIGAGFGTFCEEIKKQNFFNKIVAVEPSHDLANVCRQKNLDVKEDFIENMSLNGVSVITSFELIEHLFNPEEFVIACKKSLEKDGLFIITTPNVKGFDMITLGKHVESFQGPNHLNYFHPKSISILLEKCGFEVLEILTPGKLDAEIVRKKVLEGTFSLDNQPFLKRILIEEWTPLGSHFQNFLTDHHLSSHMWVVAKNNS